MRVYLETSALLRWILGGPDGESIRAVLAEADDVLVSRLTLIEAERALVRASATATITERESLDAAADLATGAARWSVVEILPEIAVRAGQRFPAEPIRSLDAIHLATVLFLVREIGPISILSTGERVRQNASLLGLDIAAVSSRS